MQHAAQPMHTHLANNLSMDTPAKQPPKRTVIQPSFQLEREAPLSALQTQAIKVFTLNKEMNAAKTNHDKERASLLKEMDTAGVDSVVVDSPRISAVVTTPDKTVVDVELAIELLFPSVSESVKLLSPSDRHKFYGMLYVTQTSVTENFGKSVLGKITTVEKGTRNVTVKAV